MPLREPSTPPPLPNHAADFERDEARWRVVARRVVSIGSISFAAMLVLILAPLWIPVAWLLDRTLPGDTAVLGCGLALGWYLLCEIAGVAAAAWLWLARRNHPSYFEANFALQRWWARTLFAGASRTLGLRLDVHGAEHAAEGPYFVLPRHVTTLDTLIPTLIASVQHGIHLRVVMKRELVWDPCLDIVGHRLKNAFVKREGGDREAEIERVRELARGLHGKEAVLLYPEGTRFTEAKRRRVIERLREKGDEAGASVAESYTHVLPPRFGGVLALLEERTDVDVVFVAHAGLEHLRTLGDLWRGGLRDLTIETRLWRVPAESIPSVEGVRKDWLLAQWRRIDGWVAQTLGAMPPADDAARATARRPIG